MGDRIKFITIANKSINLYDIVSHYVEGDSYVIDMLADKHIFNSPQDIPDTAAAKTTIETELSDLQVKQEENEQLELDLMQQQTDHMGEAVTKQTELNELTTAQNELMQLQTDAVVAGNEIIEPQAEAIIRYVNSIVPPEPETPEEPEEP